MKDMVEKYVGKTGLVQLEKVNVGCQVIDVRNSWGNVQIQIKPICGSGLQWINANTFTIKNDMVI